MSDLHSKLLDDLPKDASPDAMANHFKNSVLSVLDNHAPLKIGTKVLPTKPFRNKTISEAKRIKRKAERRFRKTGSIQDKLSYNQALRNVSKVVKIEQNKFFSEKLAKSKGKAKETYNIINYLLNKTTQKIIPDGDIKTIANNFAVFFFDKVNDIRNNINKQVHTTISNNSFQCILKHQHVDQRLTNFKEMSADEFSIILSSVNKKYSSLDDIPTTLIPSVITASSNFLLELVNKSLSDGSFPDCLKVSHITPTIKDKNLDKNILAHFRPLNDVSIVSKTIEKSALLQLDNHLEENNLVMQEQSAYKKYHSCETAIAKIYDDVLRNLDSKTSVVIVFLDYSAAFDSIDQDIMLEKLQNRFGIDGVALKWFHSFLKNRKFQVKIDDHLSDSKPLLYGVPQGSVIGPRMFTLYTQEVKEIVQRHGLKFHAFADDLQIYFPYTGKPSELLSINSCLKEIKSWSEKNFLQLNKKKTKVINITVRSFDYKISRINLLDEDILVEKVVKNLGYFIDDELSMSKQVTSICRKGFGMLRNLWRISPRLNSIELKKQLVHSCILSRIDYCNSVYCDLPEKQIKRLQKLMNCSVRYIFNIRNYKIPITNFTKKCHLLPVKLRINFKICLLVYKCLNSEAPEYLSELLFMKNSLPSLRVSEDKTLLEYRRLFNQNYKSRSFSSTAPKYWNEIPRYIRESSSTEVFKGKLKTFLFDKF